MLVGLVVPRRRDRPARRGRWGRSEAIAFAAALVIGGLMIYSFWLVVTTVAFWIVRIDEIAELFSGLYQSGRWPVTIYPEWLRVSLTFLVPIAFAVTVPAAGPHRAPDARHLRRRPGLRRGRSRRQPGVLPDRAAALLGRVGVARGPATLLRHGRGGRRSRSGLTVPR